MTHLDISTAPTRVKRTCTKRNIQIQKSKCTKIDINYELKTGSEVKRFGESTHWTSGFKDVPVNSRTEAGLPEVRFFTDFFR